MKEDGNSSSLCKRRSLGASIAAKACVALLVLGVYAILFLSLGTRFQGHGHRAGKWIYREGVVQVHYSSSEVPPLYLCVTELQPNGRERVAARMRLRYGEALQQVSTNRRLRQFHYEVQCYLMRWDSEQPSLSEDMGALLNDWC